MNELAHDPIKYHQRVQAEKMFELQFKSNMKGGSIEAFRRDYPTLHDRVIIPLIESLVETNSISNAHRNVAIMWERLMMELVGEDGPGSVRSAITALKAERDQYRSLLTEIGQVLKEGRLVGPNSHLAKQVESILNSDRDEMISQMANAPQH